MRRSLLFVALLAFTSAARADDYYDHNGSVVVFQWVGEGDGFRVYYTRPRPGLPASPGELLLSGAWTAGGYVYGTAYVFSRNCGPIGYRVEGHSIGNSFDFELRGPAPIRNSRCEVVRYEWNNNSYLRFDYLYSRD